MRSVGDDRRAVRASQLESMAQFFWLGGIERLARNVAVGFRIPFRGEIAQPHIDPNGAAVDEGFKVFRRS